MVLFNETIYWLETYDIFTFHFASYITKVVKPNDNFMVRKILYFYKIKITYILFG